MQEQVRLFAEAYEAGRTLEIGSYDVNGGVRQYFDDYIGIDMREGPGVDEVMNSHNMHVFFGPDSFDTVLWLETIEHDRHWWLTLEQIHLVLKPGGLLYISTPSPAMPEHSYPEDYWRFTRPGFKQLFVGCAIIAMEFENAAKSVAGTHINMGSGTPESVPHIPDTYIGLGRKHA